MDVAKCHAANRVLCHDNTHMRVVKLPACCIAHVISKQKGCKFKQKTSFIDSVLAMHRFQRDLQKAILSRMFPWIRSTPLRFIQAHHETKNPRINKKYQKQNHRERNATATIQLAVSPKLATAFPPQHCSRFVQKGQRHCSHGAVSPKSATALQPRHCLH